MFHLRRLFSAAATALLLLACGHQPALEAVSSLTNSHWPSAQLRLLGTEIIPHDLQAAGSPVGGLSGLDYDAARGVFYALSDDRSEYSAARFYTLRWPIDSQGVGAVKVQGLHTLKIPSGQNYPRLGEQSAQNPDVPDPEGLRFDASTQSLFWTSEGNRAHAMPPLLRQMGLDGSHQRSYALPPNLRELQTTGRGPRNNLALEGVAISPDGASLWAAMESSLAQEGQRGRAAGPVRITQWHKDSGAVLRQLAYQPEAVGLQGVFGENSVSDILSWDTRYLLVLERAFNPWTGIKLRLFLADTHSGSNVLDVAALQAGAYQPIEKKLLLDFADSRLRPLDNIEGMSWGPLLSNGRRSLVFVTDNNFSRLQLTQLSAFEVIL